MTKHEYICQICEVVASKSNCFKRKVGAVFVNEDFEILATGYNNPPRGFDHCDRRDPSKMTIIEATTEPLHTCGNPCSRNLHAELNGVCQAAKRGTALKGSILYCTYLPCVDCARVLINVGICKVFYKNINEDGGLRTLAEGGISIFKW